MLSNFIRFVKKNESDIMLFVCVLLISFLSFAFGYIIAKNQEASILEFEDIVDYDYQKNE